MSLKLVKKIDFPSDILMFAIFSLYSLTLAPILTEIVQYGTVNYFVGITGIAIYFGEFYAFKFKLHMIRLRAEEQRILRRNISGEDTSIPRAGAMLWIGIFCRMMCRVGIMAVSLTALGFPVDGIGPSMSAVGMIGSTISFAAELCILIYTVVSTNLFNTTYHNKSHTIAELRKDTEWAEREIKKQNKEKDSTNELLADIVLYVYAFMLYTAWWDYVNNVAIGKASISFGLGMSMKEAMLGVLPMLFCMSLLALIPLRLAYWIEASSISFSTMDKLKTRATFFIAAAITVSPTYVGIYQMYFPK